ncbi:hypothetical protein Tco_0330720, partial [Tanacetum coccineum]
FVSCGAELSVGEEDLLTREVPSLKNALSVLFKNSVPLSVQTEITGA